MRILEKIFGRKSDATSAMILSKIKCSESEISTLHAKAAAEMADVATMTDAEHVAAEARIAATKRAIARLDGLVASLSEELPMVIASEEISAKMAADEALRQRAEALRKTIGTEVPKLLANYDKLASSIGEIVARLININAETNSLNAELRLNPVAEIVTGYEAIHRKHPDREASEHLEMRDVWVHQDGSVTPAKRDEAGALVPPPVTFDRTFGYDPKPKLERREIVVRRTSHRPGQYESSLASLHLPPGFAGGASHWPRK